MPTLRRLPQTDQGLRQAPALVADRGETWQALGGCAVWLDGYPPCPVDKGLDGGKYIGLSPQRIAAHQFPLQSLASIG